jgi:N-acyl-D-amino-acid deacylase
MIYRMRVAVLFAVLCSSLLGCAVSADLNAEFDVVIRNGKVLDGAGNPWVLADVAIKDGRFAQVGVVEGRGEKEIDARGQFVTPGWIDAMDQSGYVLRESGLAENKLLMGVTTAVGGEGGTPVPADEIADYFAQLETQGISVNFASYYSATQARVEIIGDVARKPTVTEIDAMKDKVRIAMRAGTLGLATALIYPPGSYQSTEELIDIVSASAPFGGIYATHMRDEGKALVRAVKEAIEIGEKADVKVEIFHLKAAYVPACGKIMVEAGEVVTAARNRGVDVAANLYPYIAGGTGLEITLPPEVFENGEEAALKNLQDETYVADLIRRIEAKEFGGWSELNLVVGSGGWQNIVLANAHTDEYNKFAHRNMAEIAAELNVHPVELVVDIMLKAHPNRAVAFFFMMCEDDVRTALQFPWTSIGSDAAAAAVLGEIDDLGLPHPRAYGTFPRIISEYVRKNDVLTLEDAIRKMTSWPAMRLGFRDRGLIREGLWADVVVFDYEDIEDKATWENGVAVPTGVNHVLVNGVVTVSDGEHTGAKAGAVLYGQGKKQTN